MEHEDYIVINIISIIVAMIIGFILGVYLT
jgi:hypothetical protein